MTTLEETTLSKVSEIINPVHRITSKDKWDIAKIIVESNDLVNQTEASRWTHTQRKYITIDQCFEEMTCGKWDYKTAGDMASCNTQYGMEFQPSLLKKEHFVSSEGDIEPYRSEAKYSGSRNAYNLELKAYQAAQDQLIFEGFEKLNEESVHISGELFIVGSGYMFVGTNRIYQATVFDLIIEVDRFNRTASEPIKINLHKSFIKKLIA